MRNSTFIFGILCLLVALGWWQAPALDTVPWLQEKWQRNTIQDWLIAGSIFIVVAFGLLLLNAWLKKLFTNVPPNAKAWRQDFADVIGRTNSLFLLILALRVGSEFVRLSNKTDAMLSQILIIAFFLQVAFWLNELVANLAVAYARARADQSGTIANALTLIRVFSRMAVWVLTILLILDNLGFNVTALIAGLGIGGVAIALAAQNVLADLFASLSIVLDKPFVVGDFVQVQDKSGTVEIIGIKTTRIRSLTGEQIIMGNGDLLKNRIHNYQRLTERRVAINLLLAHDNNPEKLALLPSMVEKIIADEQKQRTLLRFDRIHLADITINGFQYELIYWIDSNDFRLHVDVRQNILLHLAQDMAKAGLSFARAPS